MYLNPEKKELVESCSKGKACNTQPPPSPTSPSPKTEHSSDDLRTGHFQYLQDTGESSLRHCYLPQVTVGENVDMLNGTACYLCQIKEFGIWGDFILNNLITTVAE